MTLFLKKQAWNISASTYDIMAFLLTFSFLLLFMYQFYCMKTESHMSTLLKFMCIIYVSFYCIRYLQASIFVILYPSRNFNDQQDEIDTIIGNIGFIIAHTAFYTILLLRLYFAFMGTILILKKCELYSYITSLIIITALNSVMLFSNAHNHILLFCLIAINVIVGLALIISFTERLFKLVVNQRDFFRTNSNSDGILKKECIPMNRSQLDTISTITRYTLLCSMAIAAKSVALLYYGIFLAYSTNDELKYSIYHLINKWLFMPVLFIEIFCIWLTFGFNVEKYEHCCRILHNECETDCTKLAEHKIRKHIMIQKASLSLAQTTHVDH
eukprot:123458_1